MGTGSALKDSKKLVCQYKFMTSGLEAGISLMNCTEDSEVGMFEELDTDV